MSTIETLEKAMKYVQSLNSKAALQLQASKYMFKVTIETLEKGVKYVPSLNSKDTRRCH